MASFGKIFISAFLFVALTSSSDAAPTAKQISEYRAILNKIANNEAVTFEEASQLIKVLDANEDGNITRTEVRAFAAQLFQDPKEKDKGDRIFDLFDEDGNNVITPDEVILGFLKFSRPQ